MKDKLLTTKPSNYFIPILTQKLKNSQYEFPIKIEAKPRDKKQASP